MKNLLITILSLLMFQLSLGLALASSGGNGVGNGGDAVVCRGANGEIQSARLLDFWEYFDFLQRDLAPEFLALENESLILEGSGRDKTLFKLSLESVQRTQQILEQFVFPKLSWRYPAHVKILREYFEAFANEAFFVPNIELTDIPDSDHIAFPLGCQPEQFINQTPSKKLLPGRPRYVYNKDIWDEMNALHQIGSIMHELIYRVEVEAGAMNSIFTRDLNAQLFSANFASFEESPAELFSASLAKGFAEFNFHGGNFKIQQTSGFHKTKVPRELIPVFDPTQKEWRFEIEDQIRAHFYSRQVFEPYGSERSSWRLDAEGRVESIYTNSSILVRFSKEQGLISAHGKIVFSDEGDLIAASSLDVEQGEPIQLDGIHFYAASNFLRKGSSFAASPIWLSKPYTLDIGTDKIVLPKDSMIERLLSKDQSTSYIPSFESANSLQVRLPKFSQELRTLEGQLSKYRLSPDGKITGFEGSIQVTGTEVYVMDQAGLRININPNSRVYVNSVLEQVDVELSTKQSREVRKKYPSKFMSFRFSELRDP